MRRPLGTLGWTLSCAVVCLIACGGGFEGAGPRAVVIGIDVGIIDSGKKNRQEFNRAISQISQEMLKSAITFHFHLSEHIGGQYYSASIDEYERALKHQIGDYVIINEMLSGAVITGDRSLFKEYQGEIIDKYFFHPKQDNKYHEAYLRGLHHINRFSSPEDMSKAIEYLERAIEIDPGYALAHSALSGCYTFVGALGFLPPSDVMPKAEAAALKALGLDEALAEAHLSLGVFYLSYEWDWMGAKRELERALELAEEAVRLDPQPPLLDTLGYVHLKLRENQKAVDAFRRSLAADPNVPSVRYRLGLALVQLGDSDGAREAFEEALRAGAFPESEAAEREAARLAQP